MILVGGTVATLLFWLAGAPLLVVVVVVVVGCVLWSKGDTHVAPPHENCPTCAAPDHIYPHSRGGADHVDNLATACTHCNMSKGNRTPEEWMAGLDVYSVARERAVIPDQVRLTIYERDRWQCVYCQVHVHDPDLVGRATARGWPCSRSGSYLS